MACRTKKYGNVIKAENICSDECNISLHWVYEEHKGVENNGGTVCVPHTCASACLRGSSVWAGPLSLAGCVHILALLLTSFVTLDIP